MRAPLKSPFKSPAFRHIVLAAAGVGALITARGAPAQTGSQVLHDIAALKAQVQGFAGGAPASINPRLLVPRCPSPALSWARDDVVRADCASPAWTLFVPIDHTYAAAGSLQPQARARPAIRPLIKRGERVLVEAGGAGWAVSIEAEAERDAEGSRIALKSASGRRFIARIEDGGKVVLPR